MPLMTEAKRRGVASLVQAARAGWHSLPPAILDDYTQLETLNAQYQADPQQVTADTAAAVTAQLLDATGGGEANTLIEMDIQAALLTFFSDFTTDATAAGAYTAEPKPTLALLEEPDAVQQAYTRLAESNRRWTAIRTSWKILRGRSLATTRDPAGLDSLHAEVSNLLTLRPIWQPGHWSGRLASPWQHSAFHVRLKWLLDNGAQVWAPTAVEQSIAYRDNNPELAIHW